MLRYSIFLVASQEDTEVDADKKDAPTQGKTASGLPVAADPYLGYLCPAMGTTGSLSVAATAVSTLAAWQGCSKKDVTPSNKETESAVDFNESNFTDFGVFGYVTSSRLKILAIVEETAATYVDPNLRPVSASFNGVTVLLSF